MSERKYEFRKFLEKIHEPDLRDSSRKVREDEIEINGSWIIRVSENASEFLLRAAGDLADYLQVSMNIGVRVLRSDKEIPCSIFFTRDPGLTVKRSFRLTAGSGSVVIAGADDRGCAMGGYYLESLMTLNSGPYIPVTENLLKEPLFSPRMVHSAYGMDQFTEAYLKRIAHAGYDAVLIYVKGDPFHSINGVEDFNHLIDTAGECGLDVYLYSAIPNIYHPDAPEAKDFYESKYGELFRIYPKARGLVLVGESCQYPSKDPATTGTIVRRSEPCYSDGKPAPGWWPCNDFSRFVTVVRDAVHKYAPHADIIVWTYNWGYAPEHLRTKLIRDLPDNVSVELNFELLDTVKIWGTQEQALDYTLSVTGPGKLFRTEGQAVKERKLPLYTMSNTGGKTWDMGAAPYQPGVQQWGKRMLNLLQAKKDFGLQGLMESHHYGWYPSVISDLSQWLFWSNAPEYDRILRALAARDFSEEDADTVLSVWQKWSDAIASFITPIEDQYGPCRVGPSYPFIFSGVSLRLTFGRAKKFPWTEANHYEIVFPEYHTVNSPEGLDISPRRIMAEIAHLPEVISAWNDGAATLEALLPGLPLRKQQKNRKMIGIARFTANTLTSLWHLKRWHLANHRLMITADPAEAGKVLDEITAIGQAELENVRRTIPLVQEDSVLGYEPSMDYVCDQAHLEWKIRQLSAVLELEIPKYRQGIDIAESLEKE